MQFDILTIFPDFFASPLAEGIVRRAVNEGRIRVGIHNIRDYALDKHHMTDDRPFGGGEGMVMKPEPLAACLRAACADNEGGVRVILLSPRGETFTQEAAARLTGYHRLVLVCGRYEGVDERFRERFVDEELSIGDYILTGGELAALVVMDAVTRLLPGVLGCEDSAAQDTFSRGLLKHGHYTRPREFEGMVAPEVLLSGDHAAITAYRFLESVRITLGRRPELLAQVRFTPAETKLLKREGLWARIEAIVEERKQDSRPRVDVALVHFPVVNRNGETIGSAVTNLDLHDIARACATYGCTTYWVVTPFREQQELAGEIVAHWTQGYGGQVNPDRRRALSGIAIRATLEEAIAGAEAIHGRRPAVLATCAREQENTVTWIQAREWIGQGRPLLLLLGTAWGLAPEVLARVDGVLPPIRGLTGFNHLSVRSAASIMLDRLLGLADT